MMLQRVNPLPAKSSPLLRVLIAVFLVTFSLLALPSLAELEGLAEPEAGPVYTSLFSDLAVGGYDPVAYFTTNKATKGSSRYEFDYQGAVWRFSSAENLAAFKKQPTAFAPQYGGFCAWAIANGDSAAGKPSFWKIVDGKLYLNYSAKVKKLWEKDIPGFIKKANANWPEAAQ